MDGTPGKAAVYLASLLHIPPSKDLATLTQLLIGELTHVRRLPNTHAQHNLLSVHA